MVLEFVKKELNVLPGISFYSEVPEFALTKSDSNRRRHETRSASASAVNSRNRTVNADFSSLA
jgi:hypothetical protein